jgi:hypothetical protein
MIVRNKLYYPKSHIIPNLYTAGREWMLENGNEYIGYYHKYIDDGVMSGAVFVKTESKKLIPYISKTAQPDNYVYSSLKEFNEVVTPIAKFNVPTLADFKNGKFTRYFIKRRNYSTYQDIFEIDKEQYKLWKLSGSGIDSKLYDAIAIDWKLTGPLHDIIHTTNTIAGVHDTNERIVILKNLKFFGIKDYLTDYIELTIYSPLISLDIKKQFGNSN